MEVSKPSSKPPRRRSSAMRSLTRPAWTKFFAHLDKMSADAFDDQCTGANPRYPLIVEIKRLFLRAYE